MNIKVNVDMSKCKFANSETILSLISDALAEGAMNVERHAKELVPKDTGALANSIRVEQTGPLRYVIAPHTDYAYYIEEGTSPHIITGNYWLWWEGAEHPVHEVHHPGNRPYLYMEISARLEAELIGTRVERAISGI